MLNRYQAVLNVWNGRNGSWEPRTLGSFKRRSSAERCLAGVVRNYTRYERHPDFGEVVDVKSGKSYEAALDVGFDVPTVGDLGYW